MPIQNGKYVNPGWLDNGPPAIDAAEMNAISKTLENLDAGGGSGRGGKRYARFVIGTSTNGWTAADCDYLCDGTADQETFLEAINALPGDGGEIKVLDGTYNFSGSMIVDSLGVDRYILISGSGRSTKINANGYSVGYEYSPSTYSSLSLSDLELEENEIFGTSDGIISFSRVVLTNPFFQVPLVFLLN